MTDRAPWGERARVWRNIEETNYVSNITSLISTDYEVAHRLSAGGMPALESSISYWRPDSTSWK